MGTKKKDKKPVQDKKKYLMFCDVSVVNHPRCVLDHFIDPLAVLQRLVPAVEPNEVRFGRVLAQLSLWLLGTA